jgi:two-component system cell cycle response regulator DivK
MNNTTAPGPVVLIVDDNATNLKLARDVLVAAGFGTLEAATGEQALELAHEHVPDVILMDLRLPDLDGREAARLLAADERTSQIPVVALSSMKLADAESWSEQSGFAGYIEKPIDVELFPAQVLTYCGGDG